MKTRSARFLAIITVLVPASVGAQTPSESPVRTGVFGGVSLARVQWTPAPAFEIESSTLGAAGVSFERRIRGPLFLETRVQWTRRGAEACLQESPLVTGEFWIDYLSVPALLKVKGRGRVRPYVSAGIDISTRLSAKARVAVEDESVTEDMGDDAKDTDLLLDAGGGFEVSAGSRSVFVEAMYSHGLRHVANLLPELPGSEADRIRTRTLQLSVGVRF